MTKAIVDLASAGRQLQIAGKKKMSPFGLTLKKIL
jgi:hypothetical protein